MSAIDFSAIRLSIASLATDHDAVGEYKPTVGELFAPEQHRSALAPSTQIVVGARGAGKSFWAGALAQEETRELASKLYPRLGLDRLVVRFGYNGFDTDGGIARSTLDARIPNERDHDKAVRVWQAVILRSARSAELGEANPESITQLFDTFADPEAFDAEMRRIDEFFHSSQKVLLVVFDALDTIAREWPRLTALTDALFEAVWSLRARKAIRAKIFIRPEQLNDEALKFVELPKLRSGRVELEWNRTDLYGLLFSQLADAERRVGGSSFRALAIREGAPIPDESVEKLRGWELVTNAEIQKKLMEQLAGHYMGASRTKGATYPWAYKHLADGKDIVTPRSFLKLFVEAAKHHQIPSGQCLTAEGIRHGLREASKVRVEELTREYRWVKRALAPLAGLKVPCQRTEIYILWRKSDTVSVIRKESSKEEFLPPFPSSKQIVSSAEEMLESAMERIGVLYYRPDGRVDMPDLFRIAARMFKLGGVALRGQ
jgi:hypothetical protein